MLFLQDEVEPESKALALLQNVEVRIIDLNF
jgi:hypothetical protein